MAETCRLFHDWPKWEPAVVMTGTRWMIDGQWHEYHVAVQSRNCRRCSAVATRELKHPLYESDPHPQSNEG